MNKQTIAIIIGIFLISLASATTITAGDCLKTNLSELKSLDNVVYDVVGNSSSMDGLIITLNETDAIANICTVLKYEQDSFTIIFIDNSTKTIVQEVQVGRRSSSSSRWGSIVTIDCDEENDTVIGDTIHLDTEKDDGSCEETFDSFPYMIGIMLVYLVAFSIFQIISRIRRKKAEQEVPEEPKQEEPKQEEPEQEEPEEPIDNLFNPEEE